MEFTLQSRAQVATELLLELNEDVSGDYVEEVGESNSQLKGVLFIFGCSRTHNQMFKKK